MGAPSITTCYFTAPPRNPYRGAARSARSPTRKSTRNTWQHQALWSMHPQERIHISETGNSISEVTELIRHATAMPFHDQQARLAVLNGTSVGMRQEMRPFTEKRIVPYPYAH